MPVDAQTVAEVWDAHLRGFNVLKRRWLVSPDGSTGDFTAGKDDGVTLQPDTSGVLAEHEVGEDARTSDALFMFAGHEVTASEVELAANNRKARPKVDLETAGDAEASPGAQVAFGSVRNPSKVADNVMDFRREADLDSNAADLDRDQIEILTPQDTGLTYVSEGTFFTVTVEAPPNTSEAYGTDHSEIEVPVLVWTGETPWR